MKNLKLNPEIILNKEFKTDFKGYTPSDVDLFLDDVLDDYQTIEDNVQELLGVIDRLQQQVNELTKKNVELQAKKKAFDFTNTTSYSSVDILKRISRLEEMMYNK